MKRIYDSITELIGNTPLIRLHKIEEMYKLNCKIYAKVEMFNPSASIKVRIAKRIIDKALERKIINQSSVIIEPTSGNTGVGLAFICAIYSLKFIAVMPENMSIERIKLIKAYGGEIVLTDKKEGMVGAVNKANELAKQYQNSYIPSQFTNKENPATHFHETGKEIYKSLNKDVDILVASIGTGGTITGTSAYLKTKKPALHTVGLEPASSALLTKGKIGSHKIQGIGANFVPKTLNLKYVDEILAITDEEAFKYARLVAKKEGLFVGISSGCALAGAIKIAQREKNKTIVVIFPDTGERYLSTDLVI